MEYLLWTYLLKTVHGTHLLHTVRRYDYASSVVGEAAVHLRFGDDMESKEYYNDMTLISHEGRSRA
jgi:hypothetical protein